MKGLMYANVEFVGNRMETLINSGASNLFMSESVTKNMKICLENTSARFKMLNSEKILACGVIREVSIKMGLRRNKETIEIVPLDGYNFVIGVNFLDQINAMIIPSKDCIGILDVRCQCVVSVKRLNEGRKKALETMKLQEDIQESSNVYPAY